VEANSRVLRALNLPTFVIPHGVSLRPAVHRGSPSRQTVLFLSRLDRKKGLELMLLALADLAPCYPELRCVIAGSGNRAYEARLKRAVRRLGLGDRVRFVGFVSGDAKQALFDSCDIFVLPSQDENFGLAAVEAMAAGMAVVLTREVAISDAVAAAQAGLVIEPDREALAISLTALLQDPALAQKCGRNARRLTIEQFSWHIVTRKLIQMYDRVRQGHHDQAAAGE
ncbi:MAG: glycosyltransferase, partial [Candidatus Binataceae bacterium]